jgi:hypothetical protein
LGISSPKIFRCEARRKEQHFVRVKIEAKMFLELGIELKETEEVNGR